MSQVRLRRGAGPAAWIGSRGGDLVPGLVLLALALKDRRRAVPVVGAVLGQAVVLNYGIKTLTRRERPCGGGHTSSFPSGHTATAATLAMVAGSSPVLLGANAALTAGARLLRGVHWLSDVVVGAALGALYGGLVRRFLGRS